MNCIIIGSNMKFITKSVQALSKIGDELYFQAKPDKLSIITLNSSRTAYVTVTFFDSFFSSYMLEPTEKNELTCKLLTKAIIGVFKGHKERNVELCRITVESNTRVSFEIKYRNDVVLKHSVRLLDFESLSIDVPKSTNTNSIVVSNNVYGQILTMFQATDEDISFEISKERTIARNYENGNSAVVKGIRTQVVLNAGEFNEYRIENETNVTLALKPFKAAVHFAEAFNINMSLNFSVSGRPLVLNMKHPILEADFVISTLTPVGGTQSTTTSITTLSKVKQLTDKDKTAIENVDWDEDFQLNEKMKSFVQVVRSLQSKPNVIKNVELDKEVIPISPESPRSKRARTVFQRCYELTFHKTMLDLGEVLALNSDPDSD